MLGVRPPHRPRPVEQLMPDEVGHAKCATGVAGRGLDPDLLEGTLALYAPVSDGVERNAAGQAQVAHSGFGVHVARRAQHRLLGDRLDRRGDVHLPAREPGFGFARGPVEERVELAGRHPQALTELEVRHVKAELSVGFEIDQVVADLRDVPGFSVGRQAHQPVLAGVEGRGEKALAACDSWCSVKTIWRRYPGSAREISRGRWSFCLAQSEANCRNDRKPRGA